MQKIKITEAEMCIMKVLWDSQESLTSNEILARLPNKEWKITTLITLAGKLIDKGIVKSVKVGRTHAHQYTALITEQEYKKNQTNSFVKNVHYGSVKSLINTLFDDYEISSDELKELRDFILKKGGQL